MTDNRQGTTHSRAGDGPSSYDLGYAERRRRYQELLRILKDRKQAIGAGGSTVPAVVLWDRFTDTPRALYGLSYREATWSGAKAEDARRIAAVVIDFLAAPLGITDPKQLRQQPVRKAGSTWLVRYEHEVAGIRVRGSRVEVRIHENGSLVMVGSTFVQVPRDVSVRARIDAAKAMAIVSATLDIDRLLEPAYRTPAPRLVLHVTKGPNPEQLAVRLAWDLHVLALNRAGKLLVGRAYVAADSPNEEMIEFVAGGTGGVDVPAPGPGGTAGAGGAGGGGGPGGGTGTFRHRVVAEVRTGISATGTKAMMPLVDLAVGGLANVYTDADGWFDVPDDGTTHVNLTLEGRWSQRVVCSSQLGGPFAVGPGVAPEIVLLPAGAAVADLAQTTCYYWLGKVREFCSGILDGAYPITNPVAPRANQTRSFADGDSIYLSAASRVCQNAAFASMIAHEWAHVLDWYCGGLVTTDGLLEGWADVVAMYCVDDSTVGLGINLGGQTIDDLPRSGDNTTPYPVDGAWQNSPSTHAMGQVWMGFAWKVRKALRALHAGDLQTADDISNRIVLATIVTVPRDVVQAVVEVFVADADGDLVAGPAHGLLLQQACEAHSLPYPAAPAPQP